MPEALKSEDLCRQAVKADRKALLVTPLEVVDRIASEWPAGWDPAAELAWGARRSAAIEGRITREQAEVHPDRNVLLQCIGAGGDVVPEYSTGEYQAGDIFLVCSDGFRHKLMEEEMRQSFGAGMDTEKKLKAAVKKAVEVNLQRKEKDNITVVAVRM